MNIAVEYSQNVLDILGIIIDMVMALLSLEELYVITLCIHSILKKNDDS